VRTRRAVDVLARCAQYSAHEYALLAAARRIRQHQADCASAGFPLQAYDNGQWGKKIKGVRRYFGSWHDDPSGADAEERYHIERRYWQADLTPPTRGGAATPSAGATLDHVCKLFLDRELERCRRGKISESHFLDIDRAIKAMLDHFGRSRVCLSIRPDAWASVRDELESKLGPDALDGYIKAVRSCSKWAVANEHLPAPLKFGDGLPTARRRLNSGSGRSQIGTGWCSCPPTARPGVKHGRSSATMAGPHPCRTTVWWGSSSPRCWMRWV
jgi:hypothetical protein